jgi:ATP-dependent DNA helicase DinG
MSINQFATNDVSTPTILDTVKRDYEILASTLPNFKRRIGQEIIMHSCAQSIMDNALLATQAGTGTGKTFAYLLGSLPFVRDQNQHLIISTNTIALQTQLIEKDIPFIIKHLAPKLKVEIAKGSSRYLCPVRMYKLLSTPEQKSILPEEGNAFATDESEPNASDTDIDTVKLILKDFNSGDFNGDLDSLEYINTAKMPSLIGRNHLSCPGRGACKKSDSCPYYAQRDRIADADIIITNHALLSQTVLTGSTVLCKSGETLENSIFIIDEAHQFPDVLRNANEGQLSTQQVKKWLKGISNFKNQSLKIANSALGQSVLMNIHPFLDDTQKLNLLGEGCLSQINAFTYFLRTNFKSLKYQDDLSDSNKVGTKDQWVLSPKKMGKNFSEEISQLTLELLQLNNFIQSIDTKYNAKFTAALENLDGKKGSSFSVWQASLRTIKQEITLACLCLERYIQYINITDVNGMATSGLARWITANAEYSEFSVHSNTINIGQKFQDAIVKNSVSTILTSATLDALGDFNFFNSRLGINPKLDNHRIENIASPFDYSNSNIITPVIHDDPNSAKHCFNIRKSLIEATHKHKSALVLFGSNKQMNETYDICSSELKNNIMMQHDYGKSELIRLHKEKIDSGKTSILFGVAGLSEGLDLQRHYLTTVIITKLPFPNPCNPMINYESRSMNLVGKNSFMNLSLPLCSRNLIQGTGRLIRTEDDFGDIYILDPRITTSRYGSLLLDCLPMTYTTPLNFLLK